MGGVGDAQQNGHGDRFTAADQTSLCSRIHNDLICLICRLNVDKNSDGLVVSKVSVGTAFIDIEPYELRCQLFTSLYDCNIS